MDNPTPAACCGAHAEDPDGQRAVLADDFAEAIAQAMHAGLKPETIRATFEGTLGLHTGLAPAPAEAEALAAWCRTCGNEVSPEGTCACWGHVAAAYERFLGIDFDTAADMAARIWDADADKARVWAADYAEDHDVDVYPDMRRYAPEAVREADKRAYPHDEDCPRCGRRQWGLAAADPMNPSDAEQETCGACGFTFEGQQ